MGERSPRHLAALTICGSLSRLWTLLCLTFFVSPTLANDYADRAERALLRGDAILVISDPHLSAAQGTFSWAHLNSVINWMEHKPRGTFRQILWMGDLLDAHAGPQDWKTRLQMMDSVVRRVSRAAGLRPGPATSSPQANHDFVTGNHDVPVNRKKFEEAKRAFRERWEAGAPPGVAAKYKPIPDDFIDEDRARELFSLWRSLGYVATYRPDEASAIELKGFSRESFGPRNLLVVEHYPASPAEMEGAWGRISGDLHDPKYYEFPALVRFHDRLYPAADSRSADVIVRAADAGSLGAKTLASGVGGDGRQVELWHTVAIISPHEGGTLYHFQVTPDGVVPRKLPNSQTTFGSPTKSRHTNEEEERTKRSRLRVLRHLYRDGIPVAPEHPRCHMVLRALRYNEAALPSSLVRWTVGAPKARLIRR